MNEPVLMHYYQLTSILYSGVLSLYLMCFFQDPIQDTLHLVFTFSQASLNCTNVSQTFLMTLTILRTTGQVFCKISLNQY